MKLLFEIEYRTRWGEQLVLLFGRRRIALQYADNGIWHAAVDRYADRTPVSYRYAVERDGARIRNEWRAHVLLLPEVPGIQVLRIRDRWQEMPADAPFHTSAFTRGIFARKTPAGGGKRHGATADPETANVTFRIILPTLRPEEVLAVAASSLDAWRRIVPFDDSRFPEWDLSLHLPEGAEYKFLVADRATLAPVRWEEGANRVWTEPPIGHEHRIEAAAVPHLPRRQWRGAGTAVPVFSLRSRESFGVGEFADLKLLVYGIDNEKKDPSLMEIRVNGVSIFKGPSPFSKKEWKEIPFSVPHKLLVAGDNDILFLNITPDREIDGEGGVQFMAKRDYTWGWFMIDFIKVLLP